MSLMNSFFDLDLVGYSKALHRTAEAGTVSSSRPQQYWPNESGASVVQPPEQAGLSMTVSGLDKSFKARKVLNSIDLGIEAGQFVAIVGKSGCGKSTFLRLLSQLDQPTAGSIDFEIPPESALAQTRIMFQDARLLPWKTVKENILLGLPKTRGADVDELLDRVGLGDRANDWPLTLSGGQRQRVALARALIHSPKLLILDEPLGALDALTRLEMQRLISKLWTDLGFTAVLVTHDVSEAVALADRVIVIEDGKNVMDIDIDLARPREQGSAGFAHYERSLLERLLGKSELV